MQDGGARAIYEELNITLTDTFHVLPETTSNYQEENLIPNDEQPVLNDDKFENIDQRNQITEAVETFDMLDDSRSAWSAQAFIDKFRNKFQRFNYDSASKPPRVREHDTKQLKGVKSLYERLKADANSTVQYILSTREELMALYTYNSKLLDCHFQVSFALNRFL